jgi:hypothetical protein
MLRRRVRRDWEACFYVEYWKRILDSEDVR